MTKHRAVVRVAPMMLALVTPVPEEAFVAVSSMNGRRCWPTAHATSAARSSTGYAPPGGLMGRDQANGPTRTGLTVAVTAMYGAAPAPPFGARLSEEP